MDSHSQSLPGSKVTRRHALAEAFVIVHPGKGIYLGSHSECDLWSKLSPSEDFSVPTFADLKAARQHTHTIRAGWRVGVSFVTVIPDEGADKASVSACVRAGLGWAFLPRPRMEQTE